MHGRSLLLVALLSACTKSEAPQPTPATSSPPTSSIAAPVGAAPPVASAAPPAPASAEPSAKAETPKKTDGGTAAPAASAEPTKCGSKPLPDCPLQAWMKSNANPPVMTSDLAALQKALETVATFAPPGYSNWAPISKDGANAAKNGDLAGAKASCRSCHDQYKQKYKAEHRARAI